MANKEQLAILKQGVKAWNDWREKNPEIKIDLSKADLNKVELGVELAGIESIIAHLGEANLHKAIVRGSNLRGANLRRADFGGAYVFNSNLTWADLGGANFMAAILSGVNLRGANLNGANLSRATIASTSFDDVDLSEVKGLEEVRHEYPSSIGIDTIYLSKGKIPEVFLRGCGVPDEMIDTVRGLLGRSIEFYSCFISYSNKDEAFAKRVHADLQGKGVRVWFAPEDVKSGEKLYEQIKRAIQYQDKLLVVLSENSLQSEWVMTELRRARKAEREEKRRKIFPIRLVDYETIKSWECFDADSSKDLAVEVREYFIPDFSNWKDHDSYQKAFERLLRDLKAGQEALEA